MAHNEIDHGLPTEAQFFLLTQESWVPHEIVLTNAKIDALFERRYAEENEHIRAGRAT